MNSPMGLIPSRQWIRPVARMGYAARGVVYFIIGLFAFLAAIGSTEEKDTQGALRTLLGQPFGEIMVWCLVAGLIGYVVWRLIQAFLDTDDHGTGIKAIGIRIGLLASAFTYTTLAIYALALLGVFSGSGGGNGGGGSGSSPVADFVAGTVGSQVAATGLAAIFLVVAGAHFWKAISRKYAEHFDCDEDTMRLIDPVSIAGLTARGMVFVVIAILLFYRGLNAGEDSGKPGLKEALQFVQELPFGAWLLGALGLGLLAFSAYSLAEARWRHISTT